MTVWRFDNANIQGNKSDNALRYRQNLDNFVMTPLGSLSADPEYGTSAWLILGKYAVNKAIPLLRNDIYKRLKEYFKIDMKNGSIKVYLDSTNNERVIVDLTNAEGEPVILE